jgi:hypothetical protein
MKVVIAVEVDGRTITEQRMVNIENRGAFRTIIGDMACRMELSTYGPPGVVAEMAGEDQPIGLGQPFQPASQPPNA